MKAKRLERGIRLFSNRTRGQSIPLIAIMILVLVAIVGLSVDVGNTYAEERKAVSASNAASIAGMNKYILASNGGQAVVNNAEIRTEIANSLRANGINVGNNSGQRQFSAEYLGSDGVKLGDVISGNSPQGVAYIRVSLQGTVDTFFARAVGTRTLPVKAQAYASYCPPGAAGSVYPIAVDGSEDGVLDGTRFKDPYGGKGPLPGDPVEYGTENVPGIGSRTWRRLYMKSDINTPGNFGWLRWMQDKGVNGRQATSDFELTASLTGKGNINQGFEEVATWPSESIPVPTDEQGRTVYPFEPGLIGGNDWVSGSPGLKNSVDVKAALDWHVQNKTMMILPIYRAVDGQGQNMSYLMKDLGVFILKGHGSVPSKGPYFDLIYVGGASTQRQACLVTPVVPGDGVGLRGDVTFWPEYAYRPTGSRPVQYVIVLDVSGSMNTNFNGEGRSNGKLSGSVVQCANGPAGAPASQNCGSKDYAWWPENERRIYVAKQSLLRLVDLMNISGNSGYTTARPPDELNLIWFNDNVPVGNTSGWLTNRTQLRTAILNAGAAGGTYFTSGGTNGAAGLSRAADTLVAKSATTRWPAPSGPTVEYKRVVIFITDGVSNVFLGTNSNLNGGSSNENTYPDGHSCKALGARVIENAVCQTNEGAARPPTYDGRSSNRDRPITSMVNVSNNNIKGNARAGGPSGAAAMVYTIAMSNIQATGLSNGVPTNSGTAYQIPTLNIIDAATGRTNMDAVIEAINAQVELPECEPRTDAEWRATIPPEHAASGANLPTYPEVGEVLLVNTSTGREHRAPIKADSGGKLSYVFDRLPQGDYRVYPYIYYRHPDDLENTVRQYSRIAVNGGTATVSDILVSVSPTGALNGSVELPIALKLSVDSPCAVAP